MSEEPANGVRTLSYRAALREAAARLKIGKTALYKALEGTGAQRSGETRTGA